MRQYMAEDDIVLKIDEYNKNGKKTIAMFCDVFYPSIDGVISVINNLSIELKKYYNIAVCVPKHKGETYKSKDYLVIGAKSFKAPNLDYEYSLAPSKDKEFLKYLSLLRIDLIHFHSPFFMGRFAVKYAKKHNIPVVATFHSQYKKDFMATMHSRILSNILLDNVVKTFNKTNLVFTLNKFCEETFRSYGLTVPIKIIGNATSMNKEIDKFQVKKVKEKFKLAKFENVFLYVGRLVKVKNLQMTLKVMNELKKRGVNFVFICVGKGSQMRYLKRLTHKYGLEKNVIFTGKIMDKRLIEALYAVSDLFIFNSTYDTEGLVVQEAATKSVPSIVVKDSGPASRITDNHNGFVAENSVTAFANKICEIISDKDNLKTVGLRAQEELPKSWDAVACEYKEEYDKLIMGEINK